MTRDIRIEKLTRQGIALLQEERELAMKADFAGLEELEVRKKAFLDQLEALGAQLDAGGPTQIVASRRAELATLFDILRRRAEENRYLLKAAEVGVKSARRDVNQLFSGEVPFGAYSENGEPVKTNYSSAGISEIR